MVSLPPNASRENLALLRDVVAAARKLDVIPEEGADIYEATLIQIANKAESERLQCLRVVEEHRHHMARAESQATALSQVVSIVYAVVNGYVEAAKRAVMEEEAKAEAAAADAKAEAEEAQANAEPEGVAVDAAEVEDPEEPKVEEPKAEEPKAPKEEPATPKAESAAPPLPEKRRRRR